MKQYVGVVMAIAMVYVAIGDSASGHDESWVENVCNGDRRDVAPPCPPVLERAPEDCDAAAFYESLRPYGCWMNVSPFGAVWRPNVLIKNASWRPYSDDGQWIWVNNTWYWKSDYEWDAPFHYGRWMKSKALGWVWIPGKEWSAAWVSWRQTSTRYDWAPLPVERSLYFGISGTTDAGFGWGFQFALTQDHYVSAPRANFCEPERVVYVQETVYWSDHDANPYDHYRRSPKGCHRDAPVVIEVERQPVRTRQSAPSRRTTAIKHAVVTSPSPPVSKAAAVKSKTVSRTSNQNDSLAGRRTSRVLDIMARSRK